MSTPTDPTGSHHDPLDAVIAEYLQQVEAGTVPDREALLARHPDLADRLREFFADYDRLDRQAGDLRLSPCFRHCSGAAPEPCRASATSATTSCWRRSPAAAWASSTRPGRSASTASSP